jgi:hypothetical protein
VRYLQLSKAVILRFQRHFQPDLNTSELSPIADAVGELKSALKNALFEQVFDSENCAF